MLVPMFRRLGTGVVVTAMVLASACAGHMDRRRDIAIGQRDRSPAMANGGPVVIPTSAPASGKRAGHGSGPGLLDPNGQPWRSPLVFRSNVPVPDDLVFVLVIGSDARPKEDVHRSHGDSLHLIAVDPRTRRGTILGFPRDSWVQIPGRGNHKITDALLLGGPELMSRTVENLTGLPVDYYVITGFGGLGAIVNELGGVDIYVDRAMNDRYSGARFKPGWHHMDGPQVLAFSRDRHDVPNGDFTRSENQGKVVLAALAKMRAEVQDDEGVRAWVRVLLRHATIDTGFNTVVQLGALGRSIDPAALTNTVVPGRVGTAPGGQSVVYLDERAARIFLDLRPDAVLGESGRSAASTTSTSTTTTRPPLSASPTTTTTSPSSSPEPTTTTSIVRLP